MGTWLLEKMTSWSAGLAVGWKLDFQRCLPSPGILVPQKKLLLIPKLALNESDWILASRICGYFSWRIDGAVKFYTELKFNNLSLCKEKVSL